MDKLDKFLDAVNEAGIEFDEEDGDTAVICEDCVGIVSKSGDEIGVTMVNRVEKLPVTIGFTREDYEEFMRDTGEDIDYAGD
jgi:hypothetical protein